jgi:hypothetical protein
MRLKPHGYIATSVFVGLETLTQASMDINIAITATAAISAKTPED